MGLLNLPAPVLSWLDAGLAVFLPPIVLLLIWAVVGAVGSMEIYRLLSPQARLTAMKTQTKEAQQNLAEFDGDFQDACPLIRRTLAIAFKRIGVVLPATLAASLPLLALIVWLDSSYGREFPPAGEPVPVEVGGNFEGRLQGAAAGAPARALVLNGAGEVVADVEMHAPVPLLHKRRWWNVVLGNPAGYLPDSAPVERVDIELPRRYFVGFGPTWMRGWEPSFFSALIVFALTFKFIRRIE